MRGQTTDNASLIVQSHCLPLLIQMGLSPTFVALEILNKQELINKSSYTFLQSAAEGDDKKPVACPRTTSSAAPQKKALSFDILMQPIFPIKSNAYICCK